MSVFISDHRQGVAVDLHGHKAHVGDSLVAPVLVFGRDVEKRESCVRAYSLGQGVGASPHEVEVASIEGAVMRVTLRPASCRGGGDTHGSATGHLAGLLLPALHGAAGGHRSCWGQEGKERASNERDRILIRTILLSDANAQ
uniref:Uncharacterized protein n=1 Tax=Pelusios castaneus TaxID=367368 RepID=A0A8C8S322_9SAUR